MSVKPYFRPENTYNIKLDKPAATAEPDKPETTVEPDELEAPLSTLKAPKELTKPIEPTIKCG